MASITDYRKAEATNQSRLCAKERINCMERSIYPNRMVKKPIASDQFYLDNRVYEAGSGYTLVLE